MGIRYAMGWCAQLGFGTDGTVFGDHLVAEPAAYELRSALSPGFAFHTTLDFGRILVAALRGDGRIDYDSHLGFSVPVGTHDRLVLAPGAALGYSFTGSGYQRFLGDARLGLEHTSGAWTTGGYVRPYVGRWRPDHGSPATLGVGVVVEVVEVVATGRR